MNDINKITGNGFSMFKKEGGIKGLALLSLKIALMAFFSTYKSMKYRLHYFDAKSSLDQKTIDSHYLPAYCEACAETIVHFQHFIELISKDFLRVEHPLLAIDASNQPIVLHKFLKGEHVSTKDLEKLKFLEFRQTFERLCTLINEKRLGGSKLEFIVHARQWIEKLSGLRNRLWHRGTFILRYPALDEFVGKYMLPFVDKVVTLPEYSSSQQFWKHKDLTCGIDPMGSIINEFKSRNFNLGKVAFLKELGRAAYANPLRYGKYAAWIDGEYRRRAERVAEAEMHEPNTSHVRSCPVCGLKSLVVYDDVETEGGDPLKGTYDKAWRYTWQVKCMCCTFELNHHLDNASVYNLPIEDYWQAEMI